MTPNKDGYFVCDLCGAFTVTKQYGMVKHRESKKCKIKQCQSSPLSSPEVPKDVFLDCVDTDHSSHSLVNALLNAK